MDTIDQPEIMQPPSLRSIGEMQRQLNLNDRKVEQTPPFFENIQRKVREIDPSIACFVPEPAIGSYDRYLKGEPWEEFQINFLWFVEGAELPFGVGMAIESKNIPSGFGLNFMLAGIFENVQATRSAQDQPFAPPS